MEKQKLNVENIHLGGDIDGGVSVVEAVNDGKTIAAKIFEKYTGKKLEVMPQFYTEVD